MTEQAAVGPDDLVQILRNSPPVSISRDRPPDRHDLEWFRSTPLCRESWRRTGQVSVQRVDRRPARSPGRGCRGRWLADLSFHLSQRIVGGTSVPRQRQGVGSTTAAGGTGRRAAARHREHGRLAGVQLVDTLARIIVSPRMTARCGWRGHTTSTPGRHGRDCGLHSPAWGSLPIGHSFGGGGDALARDVPGSRLGVISGPTSPGLGGSTEPRQRNV
jgi:hypothetical protein